MRRGAHVLAEARSLAYHRAVAERIRKHPELRERVLAWVNKRLLEGHASTPYLQAWRALLNGPIESLLLFMTENSERAMAMRQASPFAGLITPRERWEIWRRVKADFQIAT